MKIYPVTTVGKKWMWYRDKDLLMQGQAVKTTEYGAVIRGYKIKLSLFFLGTYKNQFIANPKNLIHEIDHLSILVSE